MRPQLSLAIAGKGPADGSVFWAAIAPMAMDQAIEIHFVYDHDAALVGMPASVHAHCMSGASLFAMWGEALSRATGNYVAILHLTAPPTQGWLDAIKATLADKPLIICGPVEADYPKGDDRWIGYLVEYVQFHRPIATTMNEIPGNNLVFRRELAGSPEHLASGGFSKTQLLGQWRANGIAPVWAMEAVVTHMRPIDRRNFRARRFHHARTYAAKRAAGMSLTRRAFLMITTPMVALLRVWRIARHACRLPKMRRTFFRFLVPIFASESSWALGELTGYTTLKAGNSGKLD